jgi:hypothetical protein
MVRFFGGTLLSSTGCFPLVHHGLGGFFLWRSKRRGLEMMEVYASGFAEHQGDYFISRGSASGVMTGWRTLMGIPNCKVFSPNAKGFFIEQCSWFPNEDFLWILRKGARVCAYSAKVKVLGCVQNSKGSRAQIEGNHHNTNAGDKISLFIAEIPTSLVQTNQKACSAQTGMNGIGNGVVVAVEAL